MVGTHTHRSRHIAQFPPQSIACCLLRGGGEEDIFIPMKDTEDPQKELSVSILESTLFAALAAVNTSPICRA